MVVEERPPPPPHMIVKRFGCTTIHNKALYKWIIYSFIHSFIHSSGQLYNLTHKLSVPPPPLSLLALSLIMQQSGHWWPDKRWAMALGDEDQTLIMQCLCSFLYTGSLCAMSIRKIWLDRLQCPLRCSRLCFSNSCLDLSTHSLFLLFKIDIHFIML